MATKKSKGKAVNMEALENRVAPLTISAVATSMQTAGQPAEQASGNREHPLHDQLRDQNLKQALTRVAETSDETINNLK